MLAIRAGKHQRDVDVAPLKQQLLDDLAAGKIQLATDVAALRASLSADKLSLHDIGEVIREHRHDAIQLATDLANLFTARAAYATHFHDGRLTIKQHHDDLVTALQDDKLAIRNYLRTDSAGMIAAVQKYEDDHQNGLNELNDDRGRISDDILKLRNDDGPNHT